MLMDSNSFAPSGQGPSNNMTPQPTPNPLAQPPTTPPTTPPPPPPSPTLPPPPDAPSPVAPSPAEPQPAAPPTPPTPPDDIPETIPSQPEPIPTPPPAPDDSLNVAPASPEPLPAQPISDPAQSPAPEPTPAPSPEPKPKSKSSAKFFIILGSCLIGIALIIFVLFVIPFGDNGTLWNMVTSSNNGVGSNDGIKTGDVVETGGYTYIANLDLQYAPTGYFSDGMLRASDTSNGATVFLDNAGNLAFTVQSPYYANNDFSNGLVAVSCTGDDLILHDDDTNNNYGYLDKTGNLAIPCQYYRAETFKDGYAVVLRYVNVTETISDVSEYTDEDGDESEESIESTQSVSRIKSGVIDTSGNLVLDFLYDEIYLQDGTAYAYDYDDDTTDVINLQTGEKTSYDTSLQKPQATDDNYDAYEALQSQFGDNYTVNKISEGVALVYDKDASSAYFVDANGNKVWDIDMNKIVDSDADKYREGLFPMVIWVGSDPYPGREGLIAISNGSSSLTEADIMRNSAAVFYDHQGRIIFMYRYSNSYEAYMEAANY